MFTHFLAIGLQSCLIVHRNIPKHMCIYLFINVMYTYKHTNTEIYIVNTTLISCKHKNKIEMKRNDIREATKRD